MQKLEGEFAEYYNMRKHRSGAFWEGRFWCTMIDNQLYLWDCMKYIDLNMVRAGVVNHPADWNWCGYNEIVGTRERYKVLDMETLLTRYDSPSQDQFRSNYRDAIAKAIEDSQLKREPIWTESIAIGDESFVRRIEDDTENRVDLIVESSPNDRWTIKESPTPYS